MNYKKNLISIAAAIALSSTAYATTVYVPMTNDVTDSVWKLIGVNGFTKGVASAYGSTSAGYTSGYSSVEEDNASDFDPTYDANRLVSLLALEDSALTAIEMGLDLSATIEETEPMRFMYLKIGTSTVNVKVGYKASLEGQDVEFYINDDMGTLYSSTLNQDNTYSNPATAIIAPPNSNDADNLTEIDDVLDFNSTNNPVNPIYFSAQDDGNGDTDGDFDTVPTLANSHALFYHYDAIDEQWKIWNNQLSGVANDFDTFVVGDAYWGRVDAAQAYNGSTEDNGGATSLILGSAPSSTSADIYNYADGSTKLAPGWNMIAFNANEPNIRHSATGLLVTAADTNGTIVIEDSTRTYSVDVNLSGKFTGAERALSVNIAFEKAKRAATIPPYFHVKSFASGDGADKFILISNEKFTLKDDRTTPADVIQGVVTLNGAKPFNSVGGDLVTIDNLDHNTTDTDGSQEYVTSKYGEYSLILNTLVSATDANNIDGTGAFSKINFGDYDSEHSTTSISAANGIPSVISTLPGLSTGFDTTPVIIGIDTDGDNTDDMVIVSNDKPFYVKDKTYTRVFDFSGDSSVTSYDVTVTGSVDKTVAVATDDNASDFVTAAAGIEADTKVYFAQNTANTQLIAVSTETDKPDVKDVASSTVDILTNSSSTEDIAKGAIGSVHALDEVAKITLIPHTWTITGFALGADVNDTNDTIYIEITSALLADGNGTVGVAIDPTNFGTANTDLAVDESNTTARALWFDAIVDDIKLQLSTDNLDGYAYHDYDANADNLASAKVVVVSYDVNDTLIITDGDMTAPTTDDDDEALTMLSSSGKLGGAIVSDLKTNAVYTPNYAKYGPLYTLYDAGFSARAILKAETEVRNSSSGSITWDNIDLTRGEDDWFLNNEMNVFGVNSYSGYWVYLTEKDAPTITFTEPTINALYTYYFDVNGDTTNIINSGSFTTTVTGFDSDTMSSASIVVNGVEFELKASGTNYTADFTSYAGLGLSNDSTNAITIRTTNGKGEHVSSPTYTFDITQPATPTVTTSLTTVEFASTDLNTTFHVFKDYIPELAASQAAQLIETSTVSDGSGVTSVNMCTSSKLSFGDVSKIVGITAATPGTIGESVLSDAVSFTYAVMLKGAQVLSHTYGSADDKSIYGTTYDSNCTDSTSSPAGPSDNSGVSLKSLAVGQTVLLSYEEIADVSTDLSGAYTKIFTVGGTDVIQVQSLDEYAGETFFVEYAGTMYTGVFPAVDLEASAALTAIDPVNNTLN